MFDVWQSMEQLCRNNAEPTREMEMNKVFCDEEEEKKYDYIRTNRHRHIIFLLFFLFSGGEIESVLPVIYLFSLHRCYSLISPRRELFYGAFFLPFFSASFYI